MAIDSEKADIIVPENKFAKMRGVWFMPTVGMLKRWLKRTGFVDVKMIDISVTDHEEQRKTEFMPFESLSDFLDPSDREPHDRRLSDTGQSGYLGGAGELKSELSE